MADAAGGGRRQLRTQQARRRSPPTTHVTVARSSASWLNTICAATIRLRNVETDAPRNGRNAPAANLTPTTAPRPWRRRVNFPVFTPASQAAPLSNVRYTFGCGSVSASKGACPVRSHRTDQQCSTHGARSEGGCRREWRNVPAGGATRSRPRGRSSPASKAWRVCPIAVVIVPSILSPCHESAGRST